MSEVGPLFLMFCGVAGIIGGFILWVFWGAARDAKRDQYIRGYVFPDHLFAQVHQVYPHLQLKDMHLIARALREFFLIHLRTQPLLIAMPSKGVDALWHAFILDTAEYHRFCRRAFGRYFHHLPVARMGSNPQSDLALRRTWWESCREENINARRPTRMPLLFAIDEKLSLPDALHYSLQPMPGPDSDGADGGVIGGGVIGGDGYACAGGFISEGGAGGDGSSGDGGGDGGSGGDGGGGCGGGCGGSCGGS